MGERRGEEGIPSGRASRLAAGFMILLLAGTAVVAVGANSWKDDLRVARLRVEGNRVLADDEVIRLAEVPPAAKLFAVDLGAVRQRLLRNPFVRNAVVCRNSPDCIVIAIEERLPVAAMAAGPLLLLDTAGTVLPARRADQVFDLPVVTGLDLPPPLLEPGARITAAEMREALRLIAVARDWSDELYRRVSEVHILPDGELVLYTAEFGVPVRVGRGEIPDKLARFDAFWREYVTRRGAQALAAVDLRFADQVVVRWQ